MQALIHDFEVMGTVFRFTFDKSDQELALSLLPIAHQIVVEADNTFSTYKPESEVSRIRDEKLSLAQASFDVRQIFRDCNIWSVKTEGAFSAVDPSGKWDPSGLVKAWAAQSVMNLFEANGLSNCSLNAGGDVYLGPTASAELNRIGIAKPISIATTGLEAGWLLDLSQTQFRAVATSGSAERGDHIWGKKSGLVQVSVVAEDLIAADVWATSLFAYGLDLMPVLVESGHEAMLIFEDGSLEFTPGFEDLEVSQQLVRR